MNDSRVSTAKVIDNKSFSEHGEILIQVSNLKTPVYAEIMTPIGGIPNMAMQWVPPIGSLGYILYKGGDERKPVWIGSKLVSWDPNKAEKISDADIRFGLTESDDPIKDLIIKTQNTTFEDQDFDSDENKVENILKMSKNEFTLAKIHQNDDYEYKKDHYDIRKQPSYQVISLKDDNILIKFNAEDNDNHSKINFESEKTEIESNFNDKKINLTLTESNISISIGDNSKIVINEDGNITIEGEKLVVNADKIELGGNSNKAVLFEPLRDFINQTYMSHTHPTPSGPSGPPPPASVSLSSEKVVLS